MSLPEDKEFALQGLDSLRQSVDEALERKRRLGQYAVFWRDGRVVCEGPDAPEPEKRLNPAKTPRQPGNDDS